MYCEEAALDQAYMQRCFELALLGIGKVAPNPMVGAILVHQGRIIGEGYHSGYGLPHAEPNAFAALLPSDTEWLPKSSLYVSLEPCAHFGKTPPCADLIIRKKIKRVVIACPDPFEKVDGKGIARLQQAGIEVINNVLFEKAHWINRRFFTFHTYHRPYIILKWATTADGFFAPLEPTQQWITNPLAKRLSHRWRSEEQAILIGTKTAIYDNPQLNLRYWTGKPPLRLVIDRYGTLPSHLHLFSDGAPTIVFTYLKNYPHQSEQTTAVQLDSSQPIFPQINNYLWHQNIISYIVEGGRQLLDSFVANGLWDEARILSADTVCWGKGIAQPRLTQGHYIGKQSLGDNSLHEWVNLLNPYHQYKQAP